LNLTIVELEKGSGEEIVSSVQSLRLYTFLHLKSIIEMGKCPKVGGGL